MIDCCDIVLVVHVIEISRAYALNISPTLIKQYEVIVLITCFSFSLPYRNINVMIINKRWLVVFLFSSREDVINDAIEGNFFVH